MIQEELIHPMISHFSIACLILIFFTKLAQIFHLEKSKMRQHQLQFTHHFLLFIGSLMLIPTLFLGDMAFDIVKKNLCYLTEAYQHEEMAHQCLYIFIFIMILELGFKIDLITSCLSKNSYMKYYHFIILIFIILGNYYLIKTAHLGSNLVYKQGAGVQREFKEKSCIK